MATPRHSDETESASTADRVKEFGAALREMRVAHGRELADVADHLRIRKVYLQAIEDGRFDDLPGPTYATGFVRAYADYLGLDVAEVVRRFKQATLGISTQAQLVPPSPVAEGRLPTGSVLLVAAILAAAAYGGWYYLASEGRDPGEVVAALPQRIAGMVGLTAGEPVPAAPASVSPAPSSLPSRVTPSATLRPAAPARAAPTETAPETPATGPDTAAATGEAPAAQMKAPSATPADAAAAEPAPSAAEPPPEARPSPAPSQTAAVAPPAATAETAEAPISAPAVQEAPPAAMTAPPAAPEPPPQTASAPPAARAGSTARVVLRASATSWVDVRDGEGRRIFSGLMRPGETYPVLAGPGTTMTTGNAGGLDIVVDGRTLPPLGPAGDVRRDVALDAEALLSGASSP